MNARAHSPVPAQHTASYYAASSLPQPDHPALTGEQVADVCVVGGGFSGLNTAIELAQKAAIARNESDIAGIRRELGRSPAPAPASAGAAPVATAAPASGAK